jgi:hypothetical protein
MSITFHCVRFGQVGVEASAAAIDRQAPGPFGGIGESVRYEDLFRKAVAGGAGLALPWGGKSLHSNRFWKKFITGRLAKVGEEEWPGLAWRALTPLKVLDPIPAVHLHSEETRAYAEGYVWPTGFGLCWNNWVEGAHTAEGIVDILTRLRNGEIEWSGPGAQAGKKRIKGLYHATLDHARDAFWGPVAPGTRSDLVTVVTIVSASATPSVPDAASGALKTLLDGIQSVWGPRLSPLAGDLHAESGHTVYANKDLRLVWLPDSFLARGQIHRCGCLHRNLLAASLQVEMMSAAAQLFADARPTHGFLPAAYVPFAERVLERIDFFLSGRGYSAPFLSARLEREPVRAARQSLAE